ncbi:MAG TPA: type 4a pilus biogenesis protein PilO [Candidatus Limnocylindrales bacterium]|nr:type 4a pilus biogenesis protein PilO [Candidatus Limnocylindrales bacterium]
MGISLRHPMVGHAVIVAAFVLSIGVVKTVYVEPRVREAKALRANEQKVQAELADLMSGIRDMDAWAAAHPGQDLSSFHARKALPAQDMVASFLRSIVPLADKHRVKTSLIQPAGSLMEETVSDAAGNPMTYRRAELRFHLEATYQDLGEYMSDVESMDQLVVVRSVSLQGGASIPQLGADVTIWLYGTP